MHSNSPYSVGFETNAYNVLRIFLTVLCYVRAELSDEFGDGIVLDTPQETVGGDDGRSEQHPWNHVNVEDPVGEGHPTYYEPIFIVDKDVDTRCRRGLRRRRVRRHPRERIRTSRESSQEIG